MIGNLASLTTGFNELVDSAKAAYVKVAPAELNRDKRFVFAVSQACAYVTISDGEVEVVEIQDMMKLIHSLTVITELDLHDYATTAFKETTLHLDTVLKDKGEAALAFEKQYVLNDIRAIKEDEEYSNLLRALLTVLQTSAGKNKPIELVAMREILEVLN